MKTVILQKSFNKGDFELKASWFKLISWYLTSLALFRSGLLTSSTVLVGILRLYGARIGKDVRIKPGIFIRYPWKLEVGNNSWLADCYIDNLEPVNIGKHVCISQQAMLMTGNHNYKKQNFELCCKPIRIEDGVWIAARAIVCPGVTLYSHAVLCVGGVAQTNLTSFLIYQGNPAVPIRQRKISE